MREASPESPTPLPRSRLFLLLFLSTEAMFFLALFAVYYVLRMRSAPDWPAQNLVGVIWWLGAINTVVLASSSLTMARCVNEVAANRSHRGRIWLLATLFLGVVFLGIKSYEYTTKIQHGLYPRLPNQLVHDSPNLEYLAAVGAEIKSARALRVDASSATSNESSLATLDTLHLGLFQWTSRKIAASRDPAERQQALWAVHELIEPTSRDELVKVQAYLANEFQAISTEQSQLQSRKQQLESELESAEPVSSTTLRDELTGTNNRIAEIGQRLDFFQLIGWDSSSDDQPWSQQFHGINHQLRLQLPRVLPAGNAWINTYWLLTGCHAIHLLAGLIVMGGLLLVPLPTRRTILVRNVATYWHFVDVIWLAIFAVIYLS